MCKTFFKYMFLFLPKKAEGNEVLLPFILNSESTLIQSFTQISEVNYLHLFTELFHENFSPIFRRNSLTSELYVHTALY